MQIISRRASEGIVIDGQTRVTVVEVGAAETTLEIAGPDGQTERVTLQNAPAADRRQMETEIEAGEAVLC